MRRVLPFLFVAFACGPGPDASYWLEVRATPVDGVAPSSTPEVTPRSMIHELVEHAPGRWSFRLAPISEAAMVTLEDYCPTPIPTNTRTLELATRVQIQGERAQVGYGRRFDLRLELPCDAEAEVRWEDLEGLELEVLAEGRRVRGRMPPFSAVRDEADIGEGLVPVSPRTRGTRRIRVTVESNGETMRRELEVHAAARVGGVPTVGLGTRVYLRGDHWQIHQLPHEGSLADRHEEAAALFREGPGLYSLELNRKGRWRLRDDTGNEVAISAGRHAEIPLDCGRAECHAAESEHAHETPMATAFSRHLGEERGTPACTRACHTAGEPGVDDGGFVEEARRMGWLLPASGAVPWERMPPNLRRLAGVGCTSCHGPAAIPEPAARARVYRADVCAQCHDAPPRYTNVVEWRRGRMARSDAHEGVWEGECARCHTTAGFLAHLRARPLGEERRTPPGESAVGIACAVCHDPHGGSEAPRLMRQPALPELLGEMEVSTRDRVCLGCHMGAAQEATPSAVEAHLVFGRGAFSSIDPGDVGEMRGRYEGPPRLGPRLSLAASHAAVGCVGCHGGERDLEAHRVDHDFAARECVSCHEDRPDIATIPPELAEAMAAIEARLGELPSHAQVSDRPGRGLSRRDQARFNAVLFRDRAAAWAHAGASLRELVVETQRLLGLPALTH